MNTGLPRRCPLPPGGPFLEDIFMSLKKPKPVKKEIKKPNTAAKKAQTTKELEEKLEKRRKAQSRR